MKLIHYSGVKFELQPHIYDEKELHWHGKPNGLWVSVEGEDDWKTWCEGESFNLKCLEFAYEVKLKDDARILHLKSSDEIREFTKLYHLSTRQWDSDTDTYGIRWNEVKEIYQGIIIAPYQWDCRLALETSWYYGWDCASGCIWDLDCIEKFTPMEQESQLCKTT